MGTFPQEAALWRAGSPAGVASAGLFDTLAVLAEVFLPTVAKGVIIRRPSMVALAAALDLDGRAVRRMQKTRRRYGSHPVMLRIPGKPVVLLLDAKDVHQVLAGTPEPFSSATSLKRSAVGHFEPKNVLVSSGAERADRREYNEAVLDANRTEHREAVPFRRVAVEEVAHLAKVRQPLDWTTFSHVWARMVRRVVFGDAAREDQEISDLMTELRRHANWAFLSRQRPALRERLFERIRYHVARAEPGSLAGVMAKTAASSVTAPEQQVSQWLFAFEPAGITTFRALAMVASRDRSRAGDRGYLRSAVLETLRLWPTTPLILRQATSAVRWRGGVIPEGAEIAIFTPFFHRDSETLPFADHFTPELWRDDQAQYPGAIVPFSEGAGVCPGKNLVLWLASEVLSQMWGQRHWRIETPLPERLPGTLNHFALRFR